MILRNPTPALRVNAVVCTAVLAALGLTSQSVYAQSARLDPDEERADISVFLGAGSSDNVRRSQTNEISGSYALAGVVLDVVRAGPRLNANIGADLEYRDYSTPGVDNERFGVIDASAELLAVPERFSWLFAARGGQGRTDPFGGDSPDNNEDINIFETGPRVSIPLGQRTDIRLSATAGARRFEVSEDLDNDTTDIQAGLHRALTATSELAFIISSREAEYDFSEQYNNDIERAYVAYSRQLASGSAAISAGTNRADTGSGWQSDPYLAFDWTRDVGSRSVFNTSLSSQLVDAGDNVDYDRLLVYEDSGILLSQDVYEATSLDATLVTGGTRTRFTLGAGLEQSTYRTDSALDNDQIRFNASIVRQLSTRMELGFRADLATREFENRVQQDDDELTELWFQRSFAGPFSLRVAYRRNSRSGDQTFAYDENTWTLGFQYDISTGAAERPQ